MDELFTPASRVSQTGTLGGFGQGGRAVLLNLFGALNR
jgi:hypothetical protein